MKKINIIGLIVVIILILSLIFISSYNLSLTSVPYDKSLTKAVCTDNHYCQDYELTCKNNKIIKLTPTGAAVQFSQDWEDPRSLEKRNLSCE